METPRHAIPPSPSSLTDCLLPFSMGGLSFSGKGQPVAVSLNPWLEGRVGGDPCIYAHCPSLGAHGVGRDLTEALDSLRADIASRYTTLSVYASLARLNKTGREMRDTYFLLLDVSPDPSSPLYTAFATTEP